MKTNNRSIDSIWRRQLLSYARGKVLEISVGEGANFQHYPLQVELTCTDLSARLMEQAKKEALKYGVKAQFIASPLEELELPKGSFDTVVSTFALSAFEDPISAIKQFKHWCNPDGNILLMEYGLGYGKMLQWLQRKSDPFFYKRTGYHIDLDLLNVMKKADLKMIRLKRKICGIVYMAWSVAEVGVPDWQTIEMASFLQNIEENKPGN